MFLDEPTGGVDPLSRRQFWRLIDDLARAGVAVLVTTHYLDEAEHCHRIAIIQAGRLAAHGTVKELKAIFASRPILEVRAPEAVAAMRALDAMPEVEKTSIFGTAVHAVLRSGATDRRALDRRAPRGRRHQPVLSCGVVEPSLEDVFLDVAERSAGMNGLWKTRRRGPQGAAADPARSAHAAHPALRARRSSCSSTATRSTSTSATCASRSRTTIAAPRAAS